MSKENNMKLLIGDSKINERNVEHKYIFDQNKSAASLSLRILLINFKIKIVVLSNSTFPSSLSF